MDKVKHHAQGISLHYYTIPGDMEHKGSATEFDTVRNITNSCKGFTEFKELINNPYCCW